jgi:hypothetical protein
MARGHPPKELLERRKQPPRKEHIPPDKKFSLDWKFWIGLLIAIIALWLTVEDRPTVSLGPPLDPKNLLSTQITIVNNGVLAIWDVSFGVFEKHAVVNGIVMWDNVGNDYQVPTHVLRPGEPVTTDLSIIVGDTSAHSMLHFDTQKQAIRYDQLDVALIAHFRPTWAPFWRRNRIFRFKTVKTSEGTVLQQVPAENIEDEYVRLHGKD